MLVAHDCIVVLIQKRKIKTIELLLMQTAVASLGDQGKINIFYL